MRAAFIVGAIGVAIVAGACTEASFLGSVDKIPCARDATCPSDYKCDVDAGLCKLGGGSGTSVGTKHIDDPCAPLDCVVNALCADGVCTPPASNGGCVTANHPVFATAGCLRSCASTACPSPLVCVDVRGATTNEVLRACVGPSAAVADTKCANDCGPSDDACIASTCVLGCTIGLDLCGAGRACMSPVAPDARTAGGCFVDCSRDGGACPSGTACRAFTGGAMGCVAAP
jgi:hypothetical protein